MRRSIYNVLVYPHCLLLAKGRYRGSDTFGKGSYKLKGIPLMEKQPLPPPRVIVKVTVEICRRLYGEDIEGRVTGVLPMEEHTERLLDPTILYGRWRDRGMVVERVEPSEGNETRLDLYVSAKGDMTPEQIRHCVESIKLEFSLEKEVYLIIVE